MASLPANVRDHGGVLRRLPSEEAAQVVDLAREIAQQALAPMVEEHEAAHAFPEQAFGTLGEAGLLTLPFAEEFGGGEQPYEVVLQVFEEIARVWAAVGIGVSVHSLATFAMANYGTPEQRKVWMPTMASGHTLGAYCLSEPEAGSDAASLVTRAVRDGDDYVLTGTKAWITHGGVADFYTVMARTSDDGARGVSCFLVPKDTDGLSFAAPENKMGANASPTAQVHLDGVRVPVEQRIGAEGEGFPIALAALDTGRLGIAACAIGLAQAALDAAAVYAETRVQFGKPIADFQGLSFTLADMAARIETARAVTLEAARRKDAGLPFGQLAAIAKLTATDAAMAVTTSAIQVLGGAGYTQDHPVERYFREAKVLQIVEGTNEIQRVVIGRGLRAYAQQQARR